MTPAMMSDGGTAQRIRVGAVDSIGDAVPDDLAADVAALPWYHTIDLPGGITTHGHFDLRDVVDRVLPRDLSGKRCLDAATATGFWAFEMEKRGASEVVGIDLSSAQERDHQLPSRVQDADLAVNRSFQVARRALNSSVEWKECSIYEASPERLGEFDFVFIGSVLLHLRDPVRALRALRTVTRGVLRSYEVHLFWGSLLHPRKPLASLAVIDESRWWTPNAAAHRRWLVAAGFEVVDGGGWTFQKLGSDFTGFHARDLFRPKRLRHALGESVFGVPSGWFEGRPVS
jgi:tRNA (mo5U34)-methyltransferase